MAMVAVTQGKTDEILSCTNSLGFTGKLPKDRGKKKPNHNNFLQRAILGTVSCSLSSLVIVFPPLAVASESGKELWNHQSPSQFMGGCIW